MNKPAEGSHKKPVDALQERLTNYACGLKYEDLPPDVIHAVKVRTIDTLAALMGGFFAEPCRIARDIAAEMPNPKGATVIGTRMKTTADMAAFVNGTTHRFIELTDSYHWPGAVGGHPSDVLTPIFSAAEYAQASGRDFITSVVLGYEAYLRISDIFPNMGFDQTNFCLIGTTLGAGKVMKLTPQQLSQAISMAVVPNNSLRVSRMGHLSMWKVTATGQAGRAGVFAAMLARAGMEGANLPFEGPSGWFEHVSKERLTLDTMGGKGTPFKIPTTSIKLRPSNGLALASTLAAEQAGRLKDVKGVKQVIVEVNQRAKDLVGTHAHHWDPDTKETADHSAAYMVAATLVDGKLTSASFNDAHLWDPDLRGLMAKVEVHPNEEFTKAYQQKPSIHKARVTVVMNNGEKFVGESGAGTEDLGAPKTDDQISEKFRRLSEELIGAKRVTALLDRLWHLDEIANVATIPPDFVIG